MKRWLPLAAGAIVLFLLLVLALVVFFSARPSRSPMEEDSRHTRRELLIPGIRYQLPDVEKELLNPGIRYFVDPDRPLDSGIVNELEVDLVDALRNELTPRIERAVEEMLFE